MWFKHDDAELEPLEEEVDFIITTSEELLSILPIHIKQGGIHKMDLFTSKGGLSLHYNTMGEDILLS